MQWQVRAPPRTSTARERGDLSGSWAVAPVSPGPRGGPPCSRHRMGPGSPKVKRPPSVTPPRHVTSLRRAATVTNRAPDTRQAIGAHGSAGDATTPCGSSSHRVLSSAVPAGLVGCDSQIMRAPTTRCAGGVGQIVKNLLRPVRTAVTLAGAAGVDVIRPRSALVAENAFLRQQVLVLRRAASGRGPRLHLEDRCAFGKARVVLVSPFLSVAGELRPDHC